MKGLSLTQPWATLIAIGAKKWETRSWPTAFRGQVAIHASKNYPKSCRDLSWEEPFRTALRPDGLYQFPESVCGKIIALATIEECRRTEEFFAPGSAGDASKRGVIIGPEEFAFGDYYEGRFAFRLDKVLPLHTPIECRGALGLWPVPDSVVAQIWMQINEERERGIGHA